MFWSLLLFAISISPNASRAADESCYSGNLALDVEVDTTVETDSSWRLVSNNIAGNFETYAKVEASLKNDNLELHLLHQMPPGQTGLPYNFYRITLEPIGTDHFAVDFDFTQNCESPGLSLYTGQKTTLPRLSTSQWRRARLRVWGHL